jgi:hypothetical protein
MVANEKNVVEEKLHGSTAKTGEFVAEFEGKFKRGLAGVVEIDYRRVARINGGLFYVGQMYCLVGKDKCHFSKVYVEADDKQHGKSLKMKKAEERA